MSISSVLITGMLLLDHTPPLEMPEPQFAGQNCANRYLHHTLRPLAHETSNFTPDVQDQTMHLISLRLVDF